MSDAATPARWEENYVAREGQIPTSAPTLLYPFPLMAGA